MGAPDKLTEQKWDAAWDGSNLLSHPLPDFLHDQQPTHHARVPHMLAGTGGDSSVSAMHSFA